jgi:hypothetical protein
VRGALVTPEQLADRKAQQAADVAKTKARLAEVLVGFRPGSDEHKAIRDANVQLDQMINRCNVLADGLLPYTDPDFYLELPPSRALDDQGTHARFKLEQAFPE